MALEIVRNEDFIEYFLFPNIDPDNEVEEDKILNDTLNQVIEISNNYTKKFIWHKDGVNFCARNRHSHLLNHENKEELPAHIYGISYFGDNIQDEWFIVSLLLHLTKEIHELIIRTCDSDGEFLLIEAADHLPQWANPETCEQRVYIYDGHVLLVENSSNTENVLPVKEAISKIRDDAKTYRVTKKFEEAIFERIQDFPESIEKNFHRQTVFVPIAVAALLHNNPQLIAPAVQAFCNRDPIDMKACRAMRYFPPENRVYTSVVFTKCLYAMIMHSNYLPDRRTGWQIPSSNSPHFKANLLGVKIACGFEILASQAKQSRVSIENDKEWIKYLESLKNRGYFKDLLEGSKGHQELLANAKVYYLQNFDDVKTTTRIGDEILNDMKQLDVNFEEFKKLEQSLPESDSDNWLNIAPEDLDEMLMKRYGIKDFFTKDSNANSPHLTEMLTDFLEQKSEYDGVDLNKNIPSTADNSAIHVAGGSIKTNNIDFDADAFSATVKNLLDFVIPEDKWDSQSDMSDYENDDDLLAKNIDELSKAHKKNKQENKSKKSNIDVYMEQMDRELANTTIGKSFETKAKPEKAEFDDGFDDIEDFQPVDIDMNAIKNMMESYQLQGASAGPTSNLLASLMAEEKKQNNE
ncbi:CLUMA_CG019947, isoform A [Clunio marinus]|uniref:CLUMA_CG019947, isoform A n=1 Tax=Clunio marinus TaxID=568069 RepID=A0A1J1J575_9DIPT|nr:CLUMA_CG019947, isoform A [Clunio marinus]